MQLINPFSYLSVSVFKAQPNDQDLTAYTDQNLQDILVRASAVVDSICRRTYLPTEITEQFEGDGRNDLNLGIFPLIYVKSVQLVMPGFAPFALPVGQLMIDYQRGTIRSWSPMVWQDLGIANVFPRNGLPILVDYAYGYGYPIPAPSWTYATGVSGQLAAGQYDLSVTSRTQNGESLPSATQTVTLNAQGGIAVIIIPQPGAMTYRIYGAVHNGTQSLVAESPATNYGTQTMTVNVTSLSAPPSGSGAVPSTDTSAWDMPNAFIEATRLMALSIIWEQNNKANRGLYQQRSGERTQSWRSTEGNSGKGVPLAKQEAQEILAPYIYRGLL